MVNEVVKANMEKFKRNQLLAEELGIEIHGCPGGIGLFCKKSDKYLKSFRHQSNDEIHDFLLKHKKLNSNAS